MATEASTLRELERSLAYEHACQIIEGSCRPVGDEDEDDEVSDCRDWWDAENGACELAADDITLARRYLESRGLIAVHPLRVSWIAIKDEHEEAECPAK